jgi:glycosyltransferase involved in cell wall biosynthesis
LYLVGQLTPGGLERQLWYLLQHLDRTQYLPAVAVWNYSEADTYAAKIRSLGVPIYGFPSTMSRMAKLRAFRSLVRELAPEVVHSYSFYTNFAAFWAVQGTGCLAIGSVRSDFGCDKRLAGALLGRLSATWPRSQICNSTAASDAVRRARDIFVPKTLHVVRNGVDLDAFRPAGAGPAESANCHVSILGIGSLVPIKRWDRLLAAASALKCTGHACRVQIAGSGPLIHCLQEQARQLGIAEVVTFLGHAENVSRLLSDVSFLVHTSDAEGFPNVVLEAMACGRAVVATDVGDVRYVVDHGVTGFVVPRDDDRSLRSAMVRLIEDRALCTRMGLAGRDKAEREFGVRHLVPETLAAYRATGWRDA